MTELEARSMWGQMLAAPADHPRVQVDAGITMRARALLDELTRNPSAPTAEVEHAAVPIYLQAGEHQRSGGIVEQLRLDRTR